MSLKVTGFRMKNSSKWTLRGTENCFAFAQTSLHRHETNEEQAAEADSWASNFMQALQCCLIAEQRGMNDSLGCLLLGQQVTPQINLLDGSPES